MAADFQTQVRAFAILAITVVGLAACDRDDPVAPEERASPEPGATISSPTTASDSLAWAVAMALDDSGIRQRVLEDMRESPIEGHRLQFSRYLDSPNGRALVGEATNRTGMLEDRFLSIVAGLPSLEFFMASPVHRARWRGTPDIRVSASSEEAGTLFSQPDPTLKAFSVRGDGIEITAESEYTGPVLALFPLSLDFEDPTSRRPSRVASSSDSETRNTISSRSEMFRDLYRGDSSSPSGESGTGSTPDNAPASSSTSEVGVDLGFSFADCQSYGVPDDDYDLFSDDCELAIAEAFAPELRFSFNEAHRSREEAWAVQPEGNWDDFWPSQQNVRIVYLLSYHDDGGPLGHTGDSEFIDIFVHNGDGQGTTWYLNNATLSAHWGASLDYSSTQPYDNLEYPYEYRGRPRVYVAEGKHANYRTLSDCSAHPSDYCSTGRPGPVRVHPDRNIGSDSDLSFTALLDCVTSMKEDWGYYTLPLPGIECYWTPDELYPTYVYDRFYGWNDSGSGSTGYPILLNDLGWKLDPYESPPSNLTVWPEPPDPLLVSIQGPNQVSSATNEGCYWDSQVSGGNPGYSYEWRVNGNVVWNGSEVPGFYLGPDAYSDFFLELYVTDQDNVTKTASMDVYVDWSYPGCDEYWY